MGKEALDYYLRQQSGYYHLILMDVNMPVMDGLEGCKSDQGFRQEDAAMIPVIAMTADVLRKILTKVQGKRE